MLGQIRIRVAFSGCRTLFLGRLRWTAKLDMPALSPGLDARRRDVLHQIRHDGPSSADHQRKSHVRTCRKSSEDVRGNLERAMRFELTTSTLARLRSTPELRPHYPDFDRRALGDFPLENCPFGGRFVAGGWPATAPCGAARILPMDRRIASIYAKNNLAPRKGLSLHR